jgi:hypothetical protein
MDKGRIMKVSIYKSNGKMKGERLTVKVFNDSDLMHQFLNKQDNNDWKVNTGVKTGSPLPHKTGKYAYAGQQWHNVKNLDPSILMHI